MMERVLVTGANGFIGSHLVETLLREGYEVKGLVRKTSNLEFIKELPVELIYGALTDKPSLYPAVSEVDYIFHTAGAVKARKAKDYELANYLGTKNLLETCAEVNPQIRRFVFLSSQAAAGPSDNGRPKTEDQTCNPVSIYGATKLRAEELVKEFAQKFPTIILRLSAIYGPRDSETINYFRFLKWGIRPVFGGIFSLSYIDDLVQVALNAIKKNNISSGAVYFVSDGNCYSLDDFATVAERFLRKRTIRLVIPKRLFSLYGFLAEKFSSSIINRDKIKELTQKCWTCEPNKAKQDLGFAPKFTLEQGLKITLDWYQSNGWL